MNVGCGDLLEGIVLHRQVGLPGLDMLECLLVLRRSDDEAETC